MVCLTQVINLPSVFTIITKLCMMMLPTQPDNLNCPEQSRHSYTVTELPCKTCTGTVSTEYDAGDKADAGNS